MRSFVLNIILLAFFWPTVGHAALFHLRAREHYETVRVKNLGSQDISKYQGFTNTLNYWYEQPYHYLLGIAASPLLATLPVYGSHDAGAGKRIRLLHLGVEGKYFPVPSHINVFVRGGVYAATLSTRDTLGSFHGQSALLGIGYEWDWDGIGIAPEFSWRIGKLSQNVSFTAAGPAIGVHFYSAI
jgi:hypothetical protein